MLGATGDAEKIRFKERSEGERPESQVDDHSKLLLPYINPKIDKEKRENSTCRYIFRNV